MFTLLFYNFLVNATYELMDVIEIDEQNRQTTVLLNFIQQWYVGLKSLTLGNGGFHIIIIIGPITKWPKFLQSSNFLDNFMYEPRLKTDFEDCGASVYIPRQLYKSIWVPGTRIPNAITATINRSPVSVELFVYNKSTALTHFTRMVVTLPCAASYSQFPFDDLACDMVMGTWVTQDYMHLSWMSNKPLVVNRDQMKLTTFLIAGYVYNNASTPLVGDRHIATFIMRRYATYYHLSVFTPSGFFVFLAWSSFLFPADGSRIGFCLTSLVCCNILFNSVSAALPRVGYLKGIDLWMIGCIIFIIIPLLEYVFIAYIAYWAKVSNKSKGNGLDQPLPFLTQSKYTVDDMAWWLDRVCAPALFILIISCGIAFFATYYRIVSTDISMYLNRGH